MSASELSSLILYVHYGDLVPIKQLTEEPLLKLIHHKHSRTFSWANV